MLFRTKPLLILTTLAASLVAQAETVQLPAVVVTAARMAQTEREVIGDVTVIDQQEIQATASNNLLDLLSGQPGVQITSNGGAGKVSSVFLRGNNSQHTLVLIDGIRAGSATLGSMAFQHIPLSQINRIEILRGPAASLYGSDAIGGVIQIFTKEGQKGFHPSAEIAYGSHNTFEASAGLSGGNDDTRYRLNLAHSKTDGINAIKNPANPGFYDDKDGYENNSVSFSATHQINENNEFGVSLLSAWGKNQQDGYVSDANYVPLAQSYDYRDETQNASANIWSKNRLTSNWTSLVKLGYSKDENKSFTPQSATDYRDLESRIQTGQTQLSWLNDITTGFGTLQLGAETLEQKVSGDKDYALTHRRTNSFQAGYLANFGDLSLQLNGRTDDNSQLGRHNTGSAGLIWQLNEAWQLGSTMGTAFKAPTFNDLYWPADAYSSGNPDLEPEESNNKEVFVRYTAGNIHASLTAYNNKVSNLIDWAQTRPYFYQPSNVGQALLRGATLTTDWKKGDLLAGFSYDYLDASDESGGANQGNQLARRARHAGLVFAGMTLDSWTLRAEIQAQGQRFNDPANKESLAGYALTNLSASWQVNKDWAVQARINNLFDREYEQVKDYGTAGINAMLNLRWQP